MRADALDHGRQGLFKDLVGDEDQNDATWCCDETKTRVFSAWALGTPYHILLYSIVQAKQRLRNIYIYIITHS